MKKFNIRVYGIYITESREILLADEERSGMRFTKFPGGGMEFGEGTIECLKRECSEEMGAEIEIIGHFYTTDFYQASAFSPESQVLSIYYLINIPGFSAIKKSLEQPRKDGSGTVSFRLIALNIFSENDLKFPIDKKVAGMILERFSA